MRRAGDLRAIRANGKEVTPTLLDSNLELIVRQFEDQRREYRDLRNSIRGDGLIGSFNYDDLRAAFADEADVANCYGASVANDGGEGPFICALGAVSTVGGDNNGTILASARADRHWRRIGPVYPEQFGARGDGVAVDYPAINAALVASDIVNLKAGAVYNCADYITGPILPRSGNKLIGYGAQLLNARIYADPSVSDLHLEGFVMLNEPGIPAHYFFDMCGTRWSMLNVQFQRGAVVGSAGLFGYIRGTSSYGKMVACTSQGSNGVYITGHDHVFSGNNIVGKFDDAYVIGSDDGLFGSFTYNITITGGSVKNNFAICSIGTGVGTIGVDSTVGTRGVRNVSVTGVVAEGCNSILYIKPGLTFDYRNGLVEEVNVSNCTLIDQTGEGCQIPFLIRAAKGALVRNIRINNCSARVRCNSTASERAGFLVSVKNEGTQAATIRDIFIDNVSIIDLYEGQDNSGSYPGYPIDFGIKVENELTGFGAIDNIRATNLFVNGCNRFGVYVGDGLDGCLSVKRSQFKNISRPVSALVSGVWCTSDDIEFHDNTFEAISNEPVGAAALTTTAYKGKRVSLTFGSVANGVSITKAIWSPNSDVYIWKVEVINTLAIAQSDVNYTSLTAYNMSTGGALVTATSKVTGGIAISANTPTSMNGTGTIVGTHAYLPEGGVLRFDKADTGTGRATDDMIVVVHYLEY